MSTTIDPPSAQFSSAEDTATLEEFGYEQELHRGIGGYAAFAAGFSFVSILTTVFALFALGFGLGGPAFVFTWPIVFVCQFAVCLVFAELSGKFPVAGAIYQWSRRLAGETVGWFAGWFMLIGYIVSVAALAIAMQSVLPSIWSGFQIIGDDPSLTSISGASNGILLGSVTIVACTAISSVGVALMGRITVIGVTLEIVGVFLIVGAMFVTARRGPSAVLDTGGHGHGGGYVWAFLASMLMAAYVMYGFDSAAELSEETTNPRRTAPRAIVGALLVSGIGGGLMIIAAVMAAPSLDAPEMSTQGIAWIITSQLDTWLGKALLTIVATSIFSATLAIQTSASRVMFSMARDGRLPGAKVLAKVNKRTGTPLATGVTVSVLAIAILLLNVGQAGVFTAITSVSVVIVYSAYLMVTVPALIRRLRGETLSGGPGVMSLGRWGLPVNVVAVVMGAALMINIAWPRAEIYDPAGQGWYMQYFAVLFVGATVVVGAVCHRLIHHEREVASSTS
ncbi:amino acid permease [Gordonia sp. TBRC 11910]|uniref:Amino acid permease n=1 Tax=Gordonia asplenii TaxID=2725283 RepID=A0A848KPY0_9ACTN|nr:amino acid permease [Gordonia asplenii]NMO00292.1 amino acid permease [Gordonia asplenii]